MWMKRGWSYVDEEWMESYVDEGIESYVDKGWRVMWMKG